VALGVKYLGSPLGLYRLPRDEQTLALGWYCAEHLPAGWRTPDRRLRDSVATTDEGRSFWLAEGA